MTGFRKIHFLKKSWPSGNLDRYLEQEFNSSKKGRKEKKVICLMKNELGGKLIKEFVGLRPKNYSPKRNNDEKMNSAKDEDMCYKTQK